MSLFNYIPGLAEAKALTHLVFNDKEGAKRTMETFNTKTPIVSHLNAGGAKVLGDDKRAQEFWDGGNSSLNAIPVVGHVKGLGHYLLFDVEGGNKAVVNATNTTLNIADGIPAVGHGKGLIHYALGDVKRGNKAMKAATRTTAVMGAGAAGFLAAGPAGAIAGGVAAGAEWDLVNAVVTDKKEVDGLAQIIENPTNVDSYFIATQRFIGDGFAGHCGGKIAENITAGSSAEKLATDNPTAKISNPKYQQKLDVMMEQKDVPIKVKADTLGWYYDKGLITYNQVARAMKAMDYHNPWRFNRKFR